MGCVYCGLIGGKHHYRCPNFYLKSDKICKFCGEYIVDSEQYVENNSLEFAHYDCLNKRELVDFLEIEVKTVEE